MEKKTIGKFISALRKANGMTQKELGEKLFVSDKTVSRWECDECTPELSLIPSIAEIFGITTDELLRGERNNLDRDISNSEESANKQKAKSDKQFRLMLDMRSRKYKNRTLLSIGITIFGLLFALVANVGFSNGLIAFCLAVAFCVTSEICQICFAINTRITQDEENDGYEERIRKANTGAIKTVVAVSFTNLLLIAFCLPLVTVISGVNNGFAFLSWLCYGLLFSFAVLIVFYVLYAFVVRRLLFRKGLIALSDKQAVKERKKDKVLLKTIWVSTAFALFFGICIGVWYMIGTDTFIEKEIFYSCDDFKAFVESDYDRWFRETYGQVLVNGSEVAGGDDSYHNVVGHQKIYGGITDFSGASVCTYYYNPDLYWRIDFTASAEDRMPVTVITAEAVRKGRIFYQAVESVLYYFILIDFAAAAVFYVRKCKEIEQTAQEG